MHKFHLFKIITTSMALGCLAAAPGFADTAPETPAPQPTFEIPVTAEIDDLTAQTAAPASDAQESATQESAIAAENPGVVADAIATNTPEEAAEAPEDTESVSDSGNITLDLVDVEIGEAVKLISKLSGASIITGTNMQHKVSATINDKPWKLALEMLLDQNDMRLVEREEGSGIYFVGPKLKEAEEPWTTETFYLSYLKSSEAAELLTSLLGGADEAPKTGPAARRPAARRQSRDEPEPQEQMITVYRENGRVVSYPAGNSIVVTTTASRMEEVRSVLETIDRPRPQVYIEAKIVRLKGDAGKKVGVDWSMLDGYEIGVGNLGRTYEKAKGRERGSSRYKAGENASDFDHRGQMLSRESSGRGATSVDALQSLYSFDEDGVRTYEGITRSGEAYAGIGSLVPGAAVVSGENSMSARFTAISDVRSAVFSASDLSLVISALETSDDAFFVSNPMVIVANEEKAVIDMATKEPYVTIEKRIDGTGENTTETYSTKMDVIPGNRDDNKLLPYIEQAFFSYGIKLEVTPRVNTDDNITVSIAPTLSDAVSYYMPAGRDATRYPIIESKHVKTVFSLGNGQTAVIGGLTDTSEKEIVRRVPLLGSIPLIGTYLFSHRSTIKEQHETIIFVTVGIVDPDDSERKLNVPEASRLIHDRVTPDGRLYSAEEFKALREARMREFEQGTVMEPLGD